MYYRSTVHVLRNHEYHMAPAHNGTLAFIRPFSRPSPTHAHDHGGRRSPFPPRVISPGGECHGERALLSRDLELDGLKRDAIRRDVKQVATLVQNLPREMATATRDRRAYGHGIVYMGTGSCTRTWRCGLALGWTLSPLPLTISSVLSVISNDACASALAGACTRSKSTSALIGAGCVRRDRICGPTAWYTITTSSPSRPPVLRTVQLSRFAASPGW